MRRRSGAAPRSAFHAPRQIASSCSVGRTPHPCSSTHRELEKRARSGQQTPCDSAIAAKSNKKHRDACSSAAPYILVYTTSVAQLRASRNSVSGIPAAVNASRTSAGHGSPSPAKINGGCLSIHRPNAAPSPKNPTKSHKHSRNRSISRCTRPRRSQYPWNKRNAIASRARCDNGRTSRNNCRSIGQPSE